MNPGGRVAVIGAGVTGLEISEVLTAAGIEVTLFEKAATPGGRISDVERLFPSGIAPADYILDKIEAIENNGARIHLGTEIDSIDTTGKRPCLKIAGSDDENFFDAIVSATGAKFPHPSTAARTISPLEIERLDRAALVERLGAVPEKAVVLSSLDTGQNPLSETLAYKYAAALLSLFEDCEVIVFRPAYSSVGPTDTYRLRRDIRLKEIVGPCTGIYPYDDYVVAVGSDVTLSKTVTAEADCAVLPAAHEPPVTELRFSETAGNGMIDACAAAPHAMRGTIDNALKTAAFLVSRLRRKLR